MSWRVHTASPQWLVPEVLTIEVVDREMGYEHKQSEKFDAVLVLADEGNHEAWVLTGTPADWKKMGETIVQLAELAK